MVALLAAIVTLPAAIDLEMKAARVPVVLQAIGKKMGTPLAADGAFENEVVLVRVARVEPEALLQRIARATAGKWELHDGRRTLVPDRDRRAKEEEARVAKRLATIQGGLDALAKRLEEPYSTSRLEEARAYFDEPGGPRDYSLLDKHRFMEPLRRACARALIALGAKRIAEVEWGGRVVFATHPTRMQHPWTPPPGLLESLRGEWQALQDVSSGWGDRARMELGPSRFSSNGRFAGSDLGEIGEARLSIVDPGWSRGGSIEFTIASPDGQVERTGELRLPMATQPVVTPKPTDVEDVPLPLDPLTQDYVSLSRDIYNNPRKVAAKGSALFEFLTDPLTHDPLELGSELYLGYAKARGMNLVADLNDNSFYRATGQRQSPLTTRQFETLNRGFFAWIETDGWLVLSPSEPALARRNRDDRKALARLMNGLAADGRVDLDERANYLLSRPFAASAGFGPSLACVLDGGLERSSFDLNENAQRLWATLSPSQRASGRLSFSQLDQRGKRFAERAVYVDRLVRRKGNPFDDAQFDHDIWTASDQVILGGSGEPTRLFPDGIPADAPITLVDRQELDLMLGTAGNSMLFYGEDPMYTAGMWIFYRRHPDLVEGDVSAIQWPNRYQPFSKRFAGVMLELPERLAWIAGFSDRRSAAEATDFDGLPAEFKNAIQKRIDAMEKLRADGQPPKMIYHSGNQGGAKIPPR